MRPQTAHALAQLEAAMQAFAKALVAERVPPEPPVGSVIRWQRQYQGAGKTYDWAAIRTRVGWFTTGRRGMTGNLSWAGVLDQVGSAKIYVATDFDPLGSDEPGQPAVPFADGPYEVEDLEPPDIYDDPRLHYGPLPAHRPDGADW